MACLNVDGLPPTVKAAGVYTVNLNKEGPQSIGTKQISTLVANKGWDFFGVSENFNYNDELMSELKGKYNAGTYRGKIPTSVTNVVPYLNGTKWFDTDGLNLLWKSTISVSDEAWYLWNKRNGITNDGADQLIAKGFRYYCVTVGPGMEIDVYIHHMDAETTEKDNEAREIQMNQLVDMILNSDNKRPIIIMGDSNCRYTRDKIEEIMFGRINADERFTMHDPWIDYKRGKVFPKVGDESIMVPGKFDGTNHEAFQTGEVVDKVWYIENKDAACSINALNYLQDTNFTWPDGSEISDHYPIVIDFEIEKKTNVVSGGKYFLKNVETGKFITGGGWYDAHAVLKDTGHEFTLQPSGDDFIIRSAAYGYIQRPDMYIDKPASDEYINLTWKFENVEDNASAYYITYDDNGDKKAIGLDNDNFYVNGKDFQAGNRAQQWQLYSLSTLKDELRFASETNPMDATFLIKGWNIGIDSDSDVWLNSFKSKGGKYGINYDHVNSEKSRGSNESNANYVCKVYNNQLKTGQNKVGTIWTIEKTDGNLPNGIYKVGCQIFSDNCDASIYFNGIKVDVPRENWGGQTSCTDAALKFNDGNYGVNTTITVTDNQLTINIDKTSQNTSPGAVFFDNFHLTYLGPTAETLASLDRVKEAIDDAQEKADNLNLTSYSNKAVVDAWENRLIEGDGSKEVLRTYTALACAALNQTELPADLTYAVINNSFEIYPDYRNSNYNIDGGYPLGWTLPSDVKKDSGVWNKEDAYKATENVDGDYLFNTWDWANTTAEESGTTIYQELTLNPGIYKLTAKVASHAGNKVYIYANDANTAVVANGKEAFQPAELTFIVPNRTGVKVGAAGGAINDNSFTTTNCRFFKADDFHLIKIGDQDVAAGYDLIKRAMADATSRVNKEGAPYNDGWSEKMQKYQDIIDNFTLEGNGYKECNEIYDLLRTAVFSKPRTPSTYFTNGIINNSFEFGDSYGWNVVFNGDTGVKPNSDGTYTISPVDGNYLFNTWQGGRGTIISQTIPNLPGGKWKLIANFAGDKGNYVYMEVKGQDGIESQKKQFMLNNDKETSQQVDFDFNVADNTPEVTISFGGCNGKDDYDDYGGAWYKLDNVRLQYVGDADVCFFYKRLKKAIEEADEIVATLPEKYRKKWDASRYQDLVDKHLADHDPDKGEHGSIDPMGGSGIEEINELYSRLRALIFSQKETEADMTGAIVNNSFELGDLTGWTCNIETGADAKVTAAADNDPYTTSGADEDLLFNCYQNESGQAIYQTIPDVPAGVYKLSVKIASDPGKKFYLAANNVHNPEPFEVTKNKGEFETIELEFEVARDIESKDVTIGLYPAINGDAAEFSREDYPMNPGSWYKVDDFRLELVGRYLDIAWEMETDSHGTIILPFDVDEETLASEHLEVYTIKESKNTETPLDPDINMYRILEFEKADYLHANTPYVVKNTLVDYAPAPAPEDNPETVSLKRRKAVAKAAENADENSRMHTFSGYSTNTLDTYERVKGNLLVGVMEETPASGGEHHFQMEGENVAFILHPNDDPDAHTTIEPYHAYIDHPLESGNQFVHGFYFYEPIMDLPWEMETAEYGTLILPFDAELPADLKAYRLKDVSEKRNNAIGTDAEGTYQVLEKEEVADRTDEGLTRIAANIPYFITLDKTKVAKTGKRAALRSEESGNYSYVFTGQPQNTEETYKYDGLLRGTILTDVGVKKADDGKGVHILTADGTFEPLAEDATTTIGAYHAYVNSDRADNNSNLILEEPKYDPQWSMETPNYGTIILPYSKELPEGLEAYPIESIGELKKLPAESSENSNETYQLITLGVMTTTLEANTPYIVKPVTAEEDENAPATLADESIDLSDWRDHANELASATVEKLTGVNNYTAIEEGDYILSDGAEGFEQNNRTGIKLNAHHAYIKGSDITADESGAKPTYLLLVEPQAEDEETGVAEIMANGTVVDIYSLNGVRVAHDVLPAEGLRSLEPGIYVLRSGNRTVKVIK